MRDPILGIPTKYHRHVCASALDDFKAMGWVHLPEHDYEIQGGEAWGANVFMHCIGWPIEMRAGELPPPLDIEFEHVATAVRGLGDGR